MILDLLRIRFSVRNFQGKPIPGDILHDMLEAGRLSPSGGNEPAWRFGVITDASTIARVAEAAYQQKWFASAYLIPGLKEGEMTDIDFPYFTDSRVFPVADSGVGNLLSLENGLRIEMNRLNRSSEG